MRKAPLLGAAALCGIPFLARAADHIDAPASTAEPNADITDLYAWMSEDAAHLNLVLNVHHMASAESAFSPAVQYAVHLGSAVTFGAEQSAEPELVCQFYSERELECWLGEEYVRGDPSDPAGITSPSGRVRVFAGRRDDPFFFELTGFKETVKLVEAAAPQLSFDEVGCPAVDQATSSALVSQLQSGADGAPVSSSFAGSSVLSLAAQVDKSLVTTGGPVLGIWASTHASN